MSSRFTFGKRKSLQVDLNLAVGGVTKRTFLCKDCALVNDDIIHEERDQRYPGRLYGDSIGHHIVHCSCDGSWLAASTKGCMIGALSSSSAAAPFEINIK